MNGTTASAAARRIVAREQKAAGANPDPSHVGGRILVRMREHLGRWVGVDSFDVLVERSCAVVRSRSADLRGLEWRPREDPPLRGLPTTPAEDGPPLAPVETIVEVLIELLGRFIGVEMAATLALDGWEDLAGEDNAETEKS